MKLLCFILLLSNATYAYSTNDQNESENLKVEEIKLPDQDDYSYSRKQLDRILFENYDGLENDQRLSVLNENIKFYKSVLERQLREWETFESADTLNKMNQEFLSKRRRLMNQLNFINIVIHSKVVSVRKCVTDSAYKYEIYRDQLKLNSCRSKLASMNIDDSESKKLVNKIIYSKPQSSDEKILDELLSESYDGLTGEEKLQILIQNRNYLRRVINKKKELGIKFEEEHWLSRMNRRFSHRRKKYLKRINEEPYRSVFVTQRPCVLPEKAHAAEATMKAKVAVCEAQLEARKEENNRFFTKIINLFK